MIPTTFKTDPVSGDVLLPLQLTTELQEYVAQALDENLSFFLGEWFLNLRLGLPYFERVIGQKPDLPLLDTLFRRAILQTPGVSAVVNLRTEFARATRTASVYFTAPLKDGSLITEADLRRNFIINYGSDENTPQAL